MDKFWILIIVGAVVLYRFIPSNERMNRAYKNNPWFNGTFGGRGRGR